MNVINFCQNICLLSGMGGLSEPNEPLHLPLDSNENYSCYNFQAFANIFGNLIFPDISQP